MPQIDSLMMVMTSKALTPFLRKPQLYHHKIEVDAPELKPYAHFFSGLLLFTSLSNGHFLKMKRVLHFGTSSAPKCNTIVKSKTGLLLFTTLWLDFWPSETISPVELKALHAPYFLRSVPLVRIFKGSSAKNNAFYRSSAIWTLIFSP